MSRSDLQRRSRRPVEPHVDAEADVAANDATFEPSSLDVSASLLEGPTDGYFGLEAGTMELAAQGIDVSPLMTSLALRRRAMLHADVAMGGARDVDVATARSGAPLPESIRSRMERSFQHQFGHVRIHTDAAAARASESLNAHAFAMGAHIFFGPGTYKPGSTETDRLLAHELTHVVQHDEGRIHGSGVSSPTDPLEREAYANEDRILQQLDAPEVSAEASSCMDASLALGPMPTAVMDARDGGGHEQQMASEALGEQAAQLGAGQFGLSMALRDEEGDAGGDGGATAQGPKAFEEGQEVYARLGERGKRGVVKEVREWKEGDGRVQTAPPDGWTYVVEFERTEGTEEETFVAEDMREAEEQGVPDASMPEVTEEQEEDLTCEPGEEEVSEGTEEVPETSNESTGESLDAAASSEMPVDSSELPALGPVYGPTLPTSQGPMLGPVAPISLPNNLQESAELNAINDRVIGTINDRMAEGQDIFQTAASDVDALCLDSSDAFTSSETQLRVDFSSNNNQSLQNLSTDVDGAVSDTEAAYTAFDESVEQSANELDSQLTVQATQTEQALLQSEADFPQVIQRAVEAHKILMEAEFGVVITDITNQAAEQKAQAEADGQTYGGGPAKADEIAGKLQEAKVKENYAKALRTFLDAVYEDLLAKGGMPAEQWSQTLHAPALSDVWPGMERHQQLVDEKKNRDQQAAQEARTQWEDVVSNEQIAVADQTAEQQGEVCEEQDAATEQLNQSVEEVVEQNQSTTEIVASGLEERQQEEQEALQSAVPDQSTGIDTSMWDMYVAKYEYRSTVEYNETMLALQQQNSEAMDGVQSFYSEQTSAVEDYTSGAQQSIDDQQTAFGESVQQSSMDQVQGLQSEASTIQARHIETAANAQAESEAVLSGISGAAAEFLSNTVQPALEGYSASTRERMGDLLGKMEDAVRGAAAAGAAAEKADRSKRASDVWASADYMWGTDEAKMMAAVSGTSPVQAHALCVEYQSQQGHSLSYIIQDETSGSLEEALLAWIFGDEVAAAKHTMDYAAESWFPDSDVIEPSLRGVSDAGRAALNTDPEWNAINQDDSLNAWYREGDRENALASLADMSLTQEEAALEADAALLFQSMDTIWGTDEDAAYALLEKYGPEKSAELREAYARYSYDRRKGEGAFDNLSADLQQVQTDRMLAHDINGDFNSYWSEADNDRALSAAWGNMGANRAAQLQQSANWSNDDKAALGAVSDANMYQGDDWLTGVQATQNHAVFMETMAEYEAGTPVTEADIKRGTTTQGQQTAIDNWDANQASTQTWIDNEFGADSMPGRMLDDKLTTGEADEGDMLMHGADTMGTREAWVTDALNQVKAEKDYYVRLDKLVNLGGRAADYAQSNLTPYQRVTFRNQAAGQMARLPSYLGDLDPALAGSLTTAIRNILICLNAEADGGQQFDWELLLGEALRRDKNATDMYEMADQKFKNMLPESVRSEAANNEDLQAWLNQTNETRQADIEEQRKRWEMGQEESSEGQVTETDLMLAAHIIKLKNMYDEANGVHFDTATGFLFAHANADQAAAAEQWWTDFEAQCSRVDTANQFEEASQNQLAAMATMIVTAIAGVAIAIVSLGSATALSAAMWSAGITLAAGLVNIAINFAIKGARYGAEDILTDLANTLVDAALQFATLGLSKMARVGPFLKMAAESGTAFQKIAAAAITSLPGELKGLLFNEDIWRGDNWDTALRQFFVGVAKGTATGVTADYTKEKFKGITDANGLAGMYLESAIDELTALAGDAVTNPAALEDPAYWINMGTKLGLGTLGGYYAQQRAVEILNTQPFSHDMLEHLGRLHPGALGELSEDHRRQIMNRARDGVEGYQDLADALATVGKVPDAETPETDGQNTTNQSNDQEVEPDEEELPETNTSNRDEEEEENTSDLDESLVEDEVNDEDAVSIDPTSTLVREDGTSESTAATTEMTPQEIDDEVIRKLEQYTGDGEHAQYMADYVMELDTPEQRLYAINTLEEAFAIQTTTHISQMTPEEMDVVCRSHLIHDRAFQNTDVLRKVVNAEGSRWNFHGDRSPEVGGSVGPAGNTDQLNAPQVVNTLGLDYSDDEGNHSPYVTRRDDGTYDPVNTLIYQDIHMTEEMRSSAKIPVDQALMDYAMSHEDPMIRYLATDRYYVGAQTTEEYVPPGGTPSTNPFTANGLTMPTDLMNNPFMSPNQEYFMPARQALPVGTQWYGLDSEGNRIIVLTYNGPDAHSPYTMNQNIPDGPIKDAIMDIINTGWESSGEYPLRNRTFE